MADSWPSGHSPSNSPPGGTGTTSGYQDVGAQDPLGGEAPEKPSATPALFLLKQFTRTKQVSIKFVIPIEVERPCIQVANQETAHALPNQERATNDHHSQHNTHHNSPGT